MTAETPGKSAGGCQWGEHSNKKKYQGLPELVQARQEGAFLVLEGECSVANGIHHGESNSRRCTA